MEGQWRFILLVASLCSYGCGAAQPPPAPQVTVPMGPVGPTPPPKPVETAPPGPVGPPPAASDVARDDFAQQHDAWLEHPESGERFALSISEPVRVGRYDPQTGTAPGVDLSAVRGAFTVSRRHAEIVQRGGKWMVLILPTTSNDSFVNDEPLPRGETREIRHGDAIMLGGVTLIFRRK